MPTSYVKPVKMASGVSALLAPVSSYTVPATGVEIAVIKESWITNPGTGTKNFTLSVVPVSGPTVIVFSSQVRAKETKWAEHSTALEPGEVLRVSSSDAGTDTLNYRVSGLEYAVLP